MHQVINNTKFNEDLEIEKVLITPYEKSIKILKKVVNFLGENNPLSEEVNWVIKTIISQKLYSYEELNKNYEKENLNDLKLVLSFLHIYSQPENFNPHKNRRCQTVGYQNCSDTVKTSISSFLSKYKKKIYENSSDSDSYEKNEEENKKIFEFNAYSDDENEEKNRFDILQERKNSDNSEEYKNNFNIQNIQIQNNNSEKKSNRLSTINIIKYVNKSPKKNYSSNLHLNNIAELDIQNIENDLFSFEFNIFDFYEKFKNINPFTLSSQIMLQKYDIIKYSDSKTLYNFLKTLQEHYTQIAIYHTEKHAIDILQTLFIYLYKSKVIDYLLLNKLDILSLLIAGICHDVGHKGYNNDYHIKIYSDLAITYNDKSILENYHITETFKLLKIDKLNILRNLSKNDFSYMRKRIIEMILATDMYFHSRIIALMKSRIENNNIKNGENSDKILKDSENNLFNEQQEVLNYLIHIGDISHSTKSFELTYKWTCLLCEEFWRQGDEEKEKGFNVNFLFDRNNIDIGRNQVGFIKGIIIPSFDILVNFLPEMSYYFDNIKLNLCKWNEISEEFNKKKEEDEKNRN
jgi:hypothetical protein